MSIRSVLGFLRVLNKITYLFYCRKFKMVIVNFHKQIKDCLAFLVSFPHSTV